MSLQDAAQSLAPTAEEDEYRLTINEEETEEAWGVPVGLSVYSPISDEDDRAANPKNSVLYPDYSEDAENATAFVNFLDTSSYKEEEETEVEETEAPSPTKESEEAIENRRESSDSTELSSVSGRSVSVYGALPLRGRSETGASAEQEEEEQTSLTEDQAFLIPSEEEMPEKETSKEETTEEDSQESMEEPEIAEYAVEAVTDGSVYYLSDTTPVYQSIGWGSVLPDHEA